MIIKEIDLDSLTFSEFKELINIIIKYFYIQYDIKLKIEEVNENEN